MSGSLFDQAGMRKYLTAQERFAFVRSAYRQSGKICTFCLVLAFTGARISEVLALSAQRVDRGNGAVILETLKRRKVGNFRAVPVPGSLIELILVTHEPFAGERVGALDDRRLWPWCRTTAWKYVKRTMRDAAIVESLRKPKALRHGFAVGAGPKGIQLNIVQRWLGHARLETTAMYAGALGDEERHLASLAWRDLENAIFSES